MQALAKGPKRPARPVAAGARGVKRGGLKKKQPPAAWKADYPIIRRLRAGRDAPVDSVGCERLADPRASQADFEWQCLVAAMLSSQTKDQTNAEAMLALRAYGNTIHRIARAPVQRLDGLICKVGFHRVKANNLKAAAKLILKRFGGRVPRTVEGLLALPGVGPKMAYLTLHSAFNQQDGLCIDTHVHRIANVLGWLRPRTKTPEDTRLALEAWLPKRHWGDINVCLVGLGQMQQQASHKLIDKCLQGRSPATALRLAARLGLRLRAGWHAGLDAACARRPELRRLVARTARRPGGGGA